MAGRWRRRRQGAADATARLASSTAATGGVYTWPSYLEGPTASRRSRPAPRPKPLHETVRPQGARYTEGAISGAGKHEGGCDATEPQRTAGPCRSGPGHAGGRIRRGPDDRRRGGGRRNPPGLRPGGRGGDRGHHGRRRGRAVEGQVQKRPRLALRIDVPHPVHPGREPVHSRERPVGGKQGPVRRRGRQRLPGRRGASRGRPPRGRRLRPVS